MHEKPRACEIVIEITASFVKQKYSRERNNSIFAIVANRFRFKRGWGLHTSVEVCNSSNGVRTSPIRSDVAQSEANMQQHKSADPKPRVNKHKQAAKTKDQTHFAPRTINAPNNIK